MNVLPNQKASVNSFKARPFLLTLRPERNTESCQTSSIKTKQKTHSLTALANSAVGKLLPEKTEG